MKILTKFVISAMAAILVVSANAAPTKGAPKGPTCPVCHMALSSKKSAANPTAVRLTKKGKILYCCAGCKMPASVLVKPSKKK